MISFARPASTSRWVEPCVSGPHSTQASSREGPELLSGALWDYRVSPQGVFRLLDWYRSRLDLWVAFC